MTSNAVENILAEARVPKVTEKDYLKKDDFGKIPKYIMRIKQDIEKENAYLERVREESEASERAKRRLLPMDERACVVAALKAKWERVNSDYQQITHMTVLDTIGKIRRKEHYETELKQIETDLNLLQRNEDIYIDLEH